MRTLAPRLRRQAHSRPSRTLATVLVIITAAAAAALLVAHARNSDYPDQLPGSASDVSAQQALNDHLITLPATTAHLRYSADRHAEDNDYPLAAVFTFDCAEAPAFTAANNLDQVAHWYQLIDIAVYDLATNLGANPNTPGTTWYEHVDGNRATLSVLIQPTAATCTGYLFGNKYSE